MIINGNALHIPLADKSVQCVVTSPPYWGLRDYGTATWIGGDAECNHKVGRFEYPVSDKQVSNNGSSGHQARSICPKCGATRVDNQLGLELTPEAYIANMVGVFREVWRVMRDDGTLWLNVGDSYASAWASGRRNIIGNGSRDNRVDRMSEGLKEKDLVGIPWRLAFALQADGWYLRSDIIWNKPNPMPESVTDRPTKSHEYLFLLTKRERYYYDAEAIREGVTGNTHDHGTKLSPPKEADNAAAGNGHKDWHKYTPDPVTNRNRRTVWTIPTMPYSTGVKIDRWRRVSSDAVSDGTISIVLPDCPIHAELFDLVANDFYGEYKDDLLNHIKHTYGYLVRDRVNGHHNTPGNNGHLVSNPDYLTGSYSPSAIDHNNEIHRMALDLGSNSAYIPFFEIADRIDDKPELLASFVRHLCIFGSNILPDDLGARLLDRTPHRIVDKFSLPISSECKCLYYEHYTRGAEHFATFPPALVEPCIKAGTSERGACPKCGKGWRRIISESKIIPGNGGKPKKQYDNKSALASLNNKDNFIPGHKESITTGWQPFCTCDAGEPVPCLVFDPFVGSGTVVKVAYDLGRRGVGLDLSMDYLTEQARMRSHNGHVGRLI